MMSATASASATAPTLFVAVLLRGRRTLCRPGFPHRRGSNRMLLRFRAVVAVVRPPLGFQVARLVRALLLLTLLEGMRLAAAAAAAATSPSAPPPSTLTISFRSTALDGRSGNFGFAR